MAPFRNHPVPKPKYSVNLATCRVNPSGSRRHPCGTTCAPNCFVETPARAIVPSSPKKRPNFNQYGGLSRGLWQGLLLISLKASEESPIFYALRSFTSFRMTEKSVLPQVVATGYYGLRQACLNHCSLLTAHCLLFTAHGSSTPGPACPLRPSGIAGRLCRLYRRPGLNVGPASRWWSPPVAYLLLPGSSG
jgi:hypothetical protein